MHVLLLPVVLKMAKIKNILKKYFFVFNKVINKVLREVAAEYSLFKIIFGIKTYIVYTLHYFLK